MQSLGVRAFAMSPFYASGALRSGRWCNNVRVEAFGDSAATRRVVLLSPLEWQDGNGRVHVVPEGFVSDGATLPPYVWWLMGGRLALDYIRPAIMHDFACTMRRPLYEPTSVDAARRFYLGLRAERMADWKATLCHVAVRYRGPQWTSSDRSTR